MRKLVLALSMLLGGAATQAQVVDFESFTLPTADTYYVNASMPNTNTGFSTAGVNFPYLYDTTWSLNSWNDGFVYSNVKDTLTSGFTNMYAAKTGSGFAGSPNYAVYFAGYYGVNNITFDTKSAPLGMYVTNSTFAYNSMRDGDGFAKKFGGAEGTDADWFKLVIRGYNEGTLNPDGVEFYLADFRFASSADDYIVNTWEFVDLTPLGEVDSLDFSLSSSDNGAFGMNTPAYFCMDNFNFEVASAIKNIAKADARIYPNPAANTLHIDVADNAFETISIIDVSGKTVAQQTASANTHFDVSTFTPGMYILQFNGKKGTAQSRFIKQ